MRQLSGSVEAHATQAGRSFWFQSLPESARRPKWGSMHFKELIDDAQETPEVDEQVERIVYDAIEKISESTRETQNHTSQSMKTQPVGVTNRSTSSSPSTAPVAENQVRHRFRTRSDAKVDSAQEIRFTGRFCGGLRDDIRGRAAIYISDWVDGLRCKTFSAVVLIFFACLAPAIAFGALLESFTEGDLGAVEVIVSTFVCGTVFALFSGQPLLILGGTGPVAIFESILFIVAEQHLRVPFLVMRAWTGIWVALILAVCACADLCFCIRYITRFTDEIFAALISSIFIYEALKGLVYPISKSYDVGGLDTLKDAEHDSTVLLSLLLGLGTFGILVTLRNFRKSRYLNQISRSILADFSPIVAIGLMTYFDVLLKDNATPKLRIPQDILPSKDCRQWIVPLKSYGVEYAHRLAGADGFDSQMLALFSPSNCTFGTKPLQDTTPYPTLDVQHWVPLVAWIPALLASILLYLDQNITSRLINKSENGLKKRPGYHLDMFVLALLVLICSMLGLPWMCAATVRSINHLVALTTTKQVVTKTGHTEDRPTSVVESRVSAFIIHLFIGLSLNFIWLLAYIPMAVLLGLFLTMGVTSLSSIQMWERVQLLFTDTRLYPATSYVSNVSHRKIHLFTGIQMIGFAILFIVKKSPAALFFPMVILLFIPIRRFLLPYLFTENELNYLDSEDLEECDEATMESVDETKVTDKAPSVEAPKCNNDAIDRL